MASVCFYFQVHQPYRLRDYRVFDIGTDAYFDSQPQSRLNNQEILDKVAAKCYLPANALMLDLLQTYPEFRISYSLSGVFLEQLEQYRPDVLQSFQDLVATGQVEILAETYYHSLAALYSPAEFKRQVKLHGQKVEKLFGVKPRVFRNTELIYNNALAETIADMGFVGIITEGVDRILGWRSPNFLYHPVNQPQLKMLLKNYKLSDDIAFRFSARDWDHYPLGADKFANWISQVNSNGEVVNLFMDYETFGEHQWADSGIFEFLRELPKHVLKHPDNNFVTPSQALSLYPARDSLDIPDYISWADVERDLSAWRSNDMQYDALAKIYALEEAVLQTKSRKLLDAWRKLQTSDHFYYMCTKWFADGDVHKYFNPYNSPYEAFINYMNVLQDFQLKVNAQIKRQTSQPQIITQVVNSK